MVRSAKLHEMPLNPELLAIARAGAGVNNIPVEKCAEAGVVVFNTPGANADSVKELLLCALTMASRDIVGAVEWVESLAPEGDKVPALVRKGRTPSPGRRYPASASASSVSARSARAWRTPHSSSIWR